MTTEKKAAASKPEQNIVISNNHFEGLGGPGERVTNAVTAIALAAQANAEALRTAAKALEGNTGSSTAIQFNNGVAQ